MQAPVPFEIAHEQGVSIASNGTASITLRGDGRIFKRRAVRPFAEPGQQNAEWAVVEMDGVRVYFDGHDVVVTKEDLRP